MQPRILEMRAYRGAGAKALRALDREARLPQLLDVPADAGACLRPLRVIVIGLGSVGSYFADLLARSGVASLLLVDPARFKPESVLTHPVHPRSLGRPKATVAGERAKAVCPSTSVHVYDGPVEELGLDAFIGASAVLLASDHLGCEVEVSQRCLNLGVPLIQASVHGPTLVAQVRSLANRDGANDPCLACGFVAADWEALNNGTIYACTGGPARRSGIPTVSQPQLCSTAASLAVTELLVRTSGLVQATESRQVDYCGFQHRTITTPLARQDGCPTEHRTWNMIPWQQPLASATPRELFVAAGSPARLGKDALAQVSMTVEGYRFSRLGACDCSAHPVLECFRPHGSEGSTCPDCNGPLVEHPLFSHDVVPGLVLLEHLDQPLKKLGAGAPATVLVRRGDEAFLFHAQQQVTG